MEPSFEEQNKDFRQYLLDFKQNGEGNDISEQLKYTVLLGFAYHLSTCGSQPWFHHPLTCCCMKFSFFLFILHADFSLFPHGLTHHYRHSKHNVLYDRFSYNTYVSYLKSL